MVYKDEIYIDDLLDSYLALEPIHRRSNKYVESNLKQKVLNLIDFKNKSLENVKLLKNNIKYKIVLDYINKEYNQKWIIPVVSDNKVIYSKTRDDDDKDNDENNDDLFSDTILTNNIKIIKQKNLFEKLKTNEKNYNKNKQNFKKYLNNKFNLTEAYSTENINQHLKISSNLIRISNINDIYFKERVGLEPIDNYKEIINEETNEIIKIKKLDNPMFKGEKINLTGFLILPFGHKDLNNYIFLNDGKKKILQNFGKIGEITKIKNSVPVELTINNHNLIPGQHIYISNTNCNPNIDNMYYNINIIDENTISVNIKHNIINEGNKGEIYSIGKLNYEEYKIKLVDDKIKINQILEQKNKDIEYPKLYTFNSSLLENEKNWSNLIKSIIPSIDNIISLEYPYLKKCKNLDDINKILNKYSLNYNKIYKNHLLVINKILKDNLDIIKDKYINLKSKKIKVNNQDLIYFQDADYVLSDKYINNKYILKYYKRYEYLGTDYDTIINRLKWLNSQYDNGVLYLRYINKLLADNINKKDIYIKLSKYKKDLEILENKFNKESKIQKYLNNEKSCTNDFVVTNKLKNLGKKFKNGKKILIKGNDRKYEMYKWSNNKFNKIDTSNYEILKYICEFKNKSIDKLEYEDLTCLYNNTFGCHSKEYNIYKKKYDRINDIIFNLEKFYTTLEKKKYNNINDIIPIISGGNKSNKNKSNSLNNNNKSQTNNESQTDTDSQSESESDIETDNEDLNQNDYELMEISEDDEENKVENEGNKVENEENKIENEGNKVEEEVKNNEVENDNNNNDKNEGNDLENEGNKVENEKNKVENEKNKVENEGNDLENDNNNNDKNEENDLENDNNNNDKNEGNDLENDLEDDVDSNDEKDEEGNYLSEKIDKIETLDNMEDEDSLEDDNNEKEEDREELDKRVCKLLEKINSIIDISEKYYYLQVLLDLDGFDIGLDIYSQKFKTKIMCGHHRLLLLKYFSTNKNNKLKHYNKLINKYGDNGSALHSELICKNCGENLGVLDYDDTEGFASSGQIKKSRDIWDEKSTIFRKKNLFKTDDENICNSLKFKKTLIKQGYSTKLLKKVQLICNKVIDISSKVGIELEFNDLIEIITDSTKYIPHNISFKEFVLNQKKGLFKLGKSRKFIEKISEDKFKKQYNSKIEIEKIIIIASRILITLQTSIPEYRRIGIKNKCIFKGFQDKDGIEYFVCVLELLLTMEYFDTRRVKLEERKIIINDKFNKYYNKFKKLKNIKLLFKRKIDYELKKSDSIKIKRYIYKEQKPIIDDNIDKKIKTIELTKKIDSRLKYLIQEMKENIESQSIKENILTKKYETFYGDLKINNKKEIDKLYNNNPELIKGCLNYLYLNGNRNLAVNNKIILNNNEKYLVKNKKVYYIDEGEYYGEKRFYKKVKNEKIDIKTSKKMKELEKEERNLDNYTKLNEKISKLTNKKYKVYNNYYKNNEDLLNDLLEDIKTFEYKNEYTLLVSNIAKILNKDTEEFKNRYIDFFKRLDNIDNLSKRKNMNNKFSLLKKCKKLDIDREINFNNIKLLKKFYLEFYLINFNKIKNKLIKNVEIKYIDNEKIKEKLQQLSYKSCTELNVLDIDKTSKVFKNLRFDFNYNLVNNLEITEDIWSCDYKNIKKFEKYNYSIVKSILLFIIIGQIKEHFNKINQLKNSNINKNFVENESISLFCKFIIKIIDLFMNNLGDYCVDNLELEKIDNELLHDYNKKREFRKLDLGNSEYSIDYLRLHGKSLNMDIENDNIKNSKKLNNKIDNIKNKAETILSKNNKLVSQSDINDFVENELNDEIIDKEIENDNYDFLINPINLDETNPEIAMDKINDLDYGEYNANQID